MSDVSRILTVADAKAGVATGVGRWSKVIDEMVDIVLRDPFPVWRSSEGTQIFQPFAKSTLARIIQRLSDLSVRWVEIQTTDGYIRRYVSERFLQFFIGQELDSRTLSQKKRRTWGTWTGGDMKDRRLLRVPFR